MVIEEQGEGRRAKIGRIEAGFFAFRPLPFA